MAKQDILYWANGARNNLQRNKIPKRLDDALKMLPTTFGNRTGRYFDILKLPQTKSAGYASEYMVPLKPGSEEAKHMWSENGTYNPKFFIEAMETIFKQVQKGVDAKQYATGPISVRFVKKSGAHMSMMQGHDVASIEICSAKHTSWSLGYYSRYAEALDEKMPIRAHWGLHFPGTHGTLTESHYPKLNDWRQKLAEFDSKKMFENKLTKQFGLYSGPEWMRN